MPRKAKVKKPKTFNFKGWMVGHLRRICRRYPAYYQTLNLSKETYYIESKSGKPMKRVKYKCAKCNQFYASGEVAVDHINPVVDPEAGFPLTPEGQPDWTVYINRMFCDPSQLQVLCHGCHDAKTDAEDALRKKVKQKID